MPLETKDVWKFPTAISDWFNTGLRHLQTLKTLEGTQPYAKIQEDFVTASEQQNSAIPGKDASIRALIKGFEKIGLIDLNLDGNKTLTVTSLGNAFLEATSEEMRKTILRQALMEIYFWNPLEKAMDEKFNINPYRATIKIISKLGYLTRKEIGNFLVILKDEDNIDELITTIQQHRNSATELPDWGTSTPLGTNINNAVAHLFSLYCATDFLIREGRDRIVLNPNKLPEIQQIFSLPQEEEISSTPSQRKTYAARIIEEREVREPAVQRNVTFVRNDVAFERANITHQQLINTMIRKLIEKGFENDSIKQNNHIDLFCSNATMTLLCEMKSTTNKNESSQIRKGLAQLLEYEYFDLKPERTAGSQIVKILVLESKPSVDEYLEFLRYFEINLLWLENGALSGDTAALNTLATFLP